MTPPPTTSCGGQGGTRPMLAPRAPPPRPSTAAVAAAPPKLASSCLPRRPRPSDGECVVIENHELFCEQLLPQYFKHSNFSSFSRQLNFYQYVPLCELTCAPPRVLLLLLLSLSSLSIRAVPACVLRVVACDLASPRCCCAAWTLLALESGAGRPASILLLGVLHARRPPPNLFPRPPGSRRCPNLRRRRPSSAATGSSSATLASRRAAWSCCA